MPTEAPADTDDTDDTDTTADTDDTDDTVDTGGPCPPGMALAGEACVDRWQAHLVDRSPFVAPVSGTAATAAGMVPQGYISGDVAAAACAAAGKRLCSADEWMRACAGPDGTTWPYSDAYDDDDDACNDSYAGGHPVVDYFGTADGVWDSVHLNDAGINQQAGTVDPTGAHPGCVSADGIFDLHGNLHEWVADTEGTFKGGFYADGALNGAGCGYTTTAHDTAWHDYSTGFRCCAAPR